MLTFITRKVLSQVRKFFQEQEFTEQISTLQAATGIYNLAVVVQTSLSLTFVLLMAIKKGNNILEMIEERPLLIPSAVVVYFSFGIIPIMFLMNLHSKNYKQMKQARSSNISDLLDNSYDHN